MLDIQELLTNDRLLQLLLLTQHASDAELDQYVRIIASLQNVPAPDVKAIRARLYEKMMNLK